MGMRKVKLVSVLLVVVMLAGCMTALASCKAKEEEEEKTLETYIAESESGAEELEKINQSLTNENLDGKVAVKDNDITITLTLKQSIDKKYFEKMEGSIDDMLNEQRASFKDTVASLEEESGIKGITMEFVVLNADGTEICTKSL